MFEKLKQVHIIVVLLLMVFTAGGSWMTQSMANAQQDKDISEVKVDVKKAKEQTQANKETVLVLTGELKLTNQRLKAQNEKLDRILDKL